MSHRELTFSYMIIYKKSILIENIFLVFLKQYSLLYLLHNFTIRNNCNF